MLHSPDKHQQIVCQHRWQDSLVNPLRDPGPRNHAKGHGEHAKGAALGDGAGAGPFRSNPQSVGPHNAQILNRSE
eukprot:8188567-Alexandrium_andersonii.AAC.1